MMKRFLTALLAVFVLTGCGAPPESEPVTVKAEQPPAVKETPREGYYAADNGGYRWVDSGEAFEDANLVSRDGSICEIYYYSEDGLLKAEKFRLTENGGMQPVQCLDFGDIKVWASAENGASPYEADKNTYYEDGGEEKIEDINAYLSERGKSLFDGMLVRDTSPEAPDPFYGEDGIYLRENSGVKYSRDGSRRETYSYVYLADSQKTAITREYDSILPLNERYHLYMYRKDGVYGILSVRDKKANELPLQSETAFRCIDLGKDVFIFPIGTAGDYYDKNGNKIEDLPALLVMNGKSLARDEWADKAVKFALDEGFLPPDLAFDYKNEMTKREFCALLISALRNAGYPLENKYPSPFADMDDYNVSAACALGLADKENFDPISTIPTDEAKATLDSLSALSTDYSKAEIKGGTTPNLTRQQAITAVYDVIYAGKN